MSSYTEQDVLFGSPTKRSDWGTKINDWGIESYSVRRLDEAGLILPKNIHVCTETDPALAVRDVLWAMYSGCNFATWVVPDSLFPKDLKDRVTAKLQENPNFFFGISEIYNKTYIYDTQSDTTASQKKRVFNRRIQALNLSYEELTLAKKWLAASLAVYEKIDSGLGRDPEHRHNAAPSKRDRRNAGDNLLGLHFDGGDYIPHINHNQNEPEFVEIKSGTGIDFLYASQHPGMNPIKTLSYRRLWSQADYGVLCTDQNDVNLDLKEGYPANENERYFQFKNTHPVLYQAPPWSISFMPHFYHPYFHPIHASPVKKDGQNMLRLLWDADVTIGSKFSSDDYKKWVEEKGGPMPLFDLG